MQTALECIPCFVRQALEAARFVTDDPALHERLLREVLGTTARMDMSHCPPVVACQIHRTLRDMTGVADPYSAIKDRFNRMALDMLPELSAMIAESQDPFGLAVRLSIAGNVIDLGVDGGITESIARQSIKNTLHEPFEGDTNELKQSIDAADRILYLADNAGEIVFDRLLIEQMPTDRVTLVVRGGPILNDATIEDARSAGMCELVEVIDNGSDAPGTVLEDCSEAFKKRFAQANLVISKGQGNFETLSDNQANISFMFKVKCPVIASHTGYAMGTHVLMSPSVVDH